jgi:hypothetical protein
MASPSRIFFIREGIVTFLRGGAAVCGVVGEDMGTPWALNLKGTSGLLADDESVRGARYGVKESKTMTSSFK